MKKALTMALGSALVLGMVNAQAGHDGVSSHLSRTGVWGNVTWTEASNNGLSFGTVAVDGAVAANTSRRAVFVEPDNEVDWGAGIWHRVNGTNARVYFSYDHYSQDEDRQASLVRNLGANSGVGYARVEDKYYEARVGVTRAIEFSNRLMVDVNGFFEASKLEQKFFQSNLEEPLPAGEAARTRGSEEQVKAYGPGVGAMARFVPTQTYKCFSLFAGGNFAVMYAENEYSARAVDENGVQFAFYHPEDSNSVIGKLDVSFGLDYNNRFNCNRFMFGASLGMKYMNMLNALKAENTALTTLAAGADPVNNNIGSARDWGRWGPFLNFRISGVNA